MVLECGRQNLRVMELLDEGHVERFGEPAPTEVHEGTQAGPGILVTGHDLLDLEDLLEQTAKGPTSRSTPTARCCPRTCIPSCASIPNLAGHYGGAWQKQRQEFADVQRARSLATTNCVLIPRPAYADRMFTTRVTAVPGGTRIDGDDFSRRRGRWPSAARRCPSAVDRQVDRSASTTT